MTQNPHCIYEGTIRHRRFHPVHNEFQYRVFFMYLDLDHLASLNGVHPLWSGAGVNLAYFRRRDHMGDPKTPLAEAVRDYVARHTGRRPEGSVRMLAHLRYVGHCFNPVSLYYCHDAADTRVEAVVAEIHNTPWGEEHLYVLPAEQSEPAADGWQRHLFQKAFHISPFMQMDIAYDWRFRLPGERLNVHMMNTRRGRRLFDASLSLVRKPLTRNNLARVLIGYPAMTIKVLFYIYWQALKLMVKGAPVFTHPAKRIGR